MKDIRYNEKNDIIIAVDYDTNTVELYNARTGAKLSLYAGWKNKGNRQYPAIISPRYGALMTVHRIIAFTYLRKEYDELKAKHPYDRLVVDHIDNNPMNYMPNNLRWCTQSDNMKNRRLQKPYNKEIDLPIW